jgi:hypothetical protein
VGGEQRGEDAKGGCVTVDRTGQRRRGGGQGWMQPSTERLVVVVDKETCVLSAWLSFDGPPTDTREIFDFLGFKYSTFVVFLK